MFALKRQLKLNNAEKTLMARHAGFARMSYNYGELFWLSVRDGLQAPDSKRLLAIKKCLTNVTKRRHEFAWMKQLSSRVYQSAFQSLGGAFSSWRSGKTQPPTFKRRKDGQSFTVYDSREPILVAAGKSIRLPTLGTFRLQEALAQSYASQTFTVSYEAGRWYVSFAVNADRVPPLAHDVVEPIGIDLGVTCFATVSDGTELLAPKPLKQAITKLKRFQCRNRHKDFLNEGVRSLPNKNEWLREAIAEKYEREQAQQQAS